MGRYYTGDIEGKFVFGVQDSFAADRFGAEPRVLYQFDDSHIPELEKELAAIEESVSIDNLKEYHNGPDCDTFNGLEEEDYSDYADYILGTKILDCVKLNGECMFEAEM